MQYDQPTTEASNLLSTVPVFLARNVLVVPRRAIRLVWLTRTAEW